MKWALVAAQLKDVEKEYAFSYLVRP